MVLNRIFNKKIKILGIESSCDESAAAVVEDGRTVLSNVISSQIDIHARYGGVVPEVASRNHTLAINNCVEKALADANCTLDDIDAIAVTYGAGLQGALLVGVSCAKALSFASNKKLIAVNHIRAHVAANYISSPNLKPPFLCLITSGGHTAIVLVKKYTEFEVVGSTMDDAVGEAYDKVARVLGINYPGGVLVDKLAQKGTANIDFPLVMANSNDYNFSYSGLKTSVINYLHKCDQKKIKYKVEDVCASFQKSAIDILMLKLKKASIEKNIKTLAIAGGVSANSYLRSKMLQLEKEGYTISMPKLILCTDNAAMVASLAYWQYKQRDFASLDLDVKASIPL